MSDSRAARNCPQELHYSITSSARPSSGRGILRPSVLAVLRLMANSTFVTCCTGGSAAFSPLRMRPVLTPIRCGRALEAGNLQKLAVADPDSGKVGLGLARRGGVAACLV